MHKQLCVVRDDQTEQRVLAQYKLLLEASRLASSRDIYNLLKQRYQRREIRNEVWECGEMDLMDLEKILGGICILSDKAGDDLYDMAFENFAKEEDIIISSGLLSSELFKHLEVLLVGREPVEQIYFKNEVAWAKTTIALECEGIKSFAMPLCALLLLEKYLDALGAAIFMASSAELEYEENEEENYWYDELSYYYTDEEVGELFDGVEV